VLLPNESFAYAYFDYERDFKAFITGMGKAIDDIRTGTES